MFDANAVAASLHAMNSVWFNQGFDGYVNSTACPYAEGTLAYRDWQAGYEAAFQDHMKMDACITADSDDFAYFAC